MQTSQLSLAWPGLDWIGFAAAEKEVRSLIIHNISAKRQEKSNKMQFDMQFDPLDYMQKENKLFFILHPKKHKQI